MWKLQDDPMDERLIRGDERPFGIRCCLYPGFTGGGMYRPCFKCFIGTGFGIYEAAENTGMKV